MIKCSKLKRIDEPDQKCKMVDVFFSNDYKDGMDNIELKKAYQQLQTSYRILQQCSIKWKETLEQCQGEIDSLQNLSEQYNCCQSANVDVIVQKLPDIKQNLLYKISLEVNKKLTKLHNLLNNLRECCERMSKQHGYSIGVVKDLPIDVVSKATETIPAFSDLVEWLNDIDILLNHQYCGKKYLLESFDICQFDSKEFERQWSKGKKDLERKMEDMLCYAQFLLVDT